MEGLAEQGLLAPEGPAPEVEETPAVEVEINYRPRMQAVTRSDIAAYARRYLVGRPHVTGVMISPEDRARINLTTAALLGHEAVP